MTHFESVAVTAQMTFGRDGAMFAGLLGFVGQLSVGVWGLVILTAVMRFVGIRIYGRGAARTGRVETVAPSAALPASAEPKAMAAIDLIHPAAGQLPDAELVGVGLFGSTAAANDAVILPNPGHAGPGRTHLTHPPRTPRGVDRGVQARRGQGRCGGVRALGGGRAFHKLASSVAGPVIIIRRCNPAWSATRNEWRVS